MEAYKQEFIEFMVESDVLKFGDFTLKSGRKSPFFMNAGAYVTGEQLMRLGEYYARAIHDNFGLDFDVVFGPAYKGIPLSVVTAIAMHKLYGKEVKYCSDRKEVKDHGADKGGMLGYELKDGDRVVMVEDVTTSGKSIDETYPKLMNAANVEVKGLIVSLNRMEVGKGGVTTAQKEIEAKYGFPVASIVSMAEVTEHLYNREVAGRVVIDDGAQGRDRRLLRAVRRARLNLRRPVSARCRRAGQPVRGQSSARHISHEMSLGVHKLRGSRVDACRVSVYAVRR